MTKNQYYYLNEETSEGSLSLPLLNFSKNSVDQEGQVQMSDEEEIVSMFLSEKLQGRTIIVIVIALVVFLGGLNVPDNEITCSTIDFAHNLLYPITNWLTDPSHHLTRDLLLILFCLSIDAIFLGTFLYWIYHETGSRFLAAMLCFGIGKAISQYLWLLPVPQEVYWVSPGIPSIVVSFGSIGEFFFSGYTGFLIICMKELKKLGFHRTSKLIGGFTVYAVFILLVLRANYSIDILTSLFFSDYCFERVDEYKEKIDIVWLKLCSLIKIKQLPVQKKNWISKW
jgi:hypothetical protein